MWGEPMLYPQLNDVLAATAPLPAWTSTNLNFSENRVRQMSKWKHFNVICAIDTLDKDAYADYRVGGDYDKVLHNLGILSAGDCRTYLQFLVDEDEHDDAPYIEFAKRYNISPHDIIIKLKRKNFTLKPTGKPTPGVCHAPFNGVYFNCDGDLFPCCNDVKEDLHILNINDVDTLDDILSGPKMIEVRQKLARDKNQYASCGQCRGGNFLECPLARIYRLSEGFTSSQQGSGASTDAF